MSTSERMAVLPGGGYVEKVEHWGSDEQIIEAARMSTNKGFQGWGPVPVDYKCDSCGEVLTTDQAASVLTLDKGQSYLRAYDDACECGSYTVEPTATKPGDEKLLRYLYQNRHSTPFEMAGLTIEVGAPIITLRQWHRHRTQSYNEMSGRYTPLPANDYVPTLARLMGQSGVTVVKNKQAGTVKGAGVLTSERAEQFRKDLAEYQALGQGHYERALADGVPKELARLFVTVGRYSRMRASANLRNWLGFMTLRCDPHAQEEIRVYSDAVANLVADAFPRTFTLWQEGRNA